jgi:3-oxoacyl-[acyl-carrier protein] reductase
MASSVHDKKSALNAEESQGGTKLMQGLLLGKIAIITGSSRGIGKGCAQIFIEQGAKVVINGRDEGVCRDTYQVITKDGGDAIICPADITKKDEVEKMISDTIDAFGHIDIVVNNAGTSRDALIHKMSDSLFRFIMDINLKGTHYVTQAILPEFKKKNRKDEFKKIINFSSVAGISGNLGQTNYAMAKSGIIAYSKACARELSLDRINVNVIAPGFIETRMTAAKGPGDKLGMPQAVRNLAISAIPFSRGGKGGMPHHVGNVALFLASNLSDWLTGQTFTVDGGSYI